jgi:hypothetical protein
MNPADPRLSEGLRLFNEREFFASHDVWEDLWSELHGSDKSFVQGLIHAAVALFHFEGGNLGGALKMYRSCRVYLSPFLPCRAGLDLVRLLSDLSDCFAELDQAHQSYPAHLSLNPERIPVLRHTRAHADSAGQPTNNPLSDDSGSSSLLKKEPAASARPLEVHRFPKKPVPRLRVGFVLVVLQQASRVK